MLSTQVSALLRDARIRRGLTQSELARRTHVSTRLVAELERGQRPNASLESVLRLLYELGVTMRLTEPSGSATELAGRDSAALARQARARHRRDTWMGAQVALGASGSAPGAGHVIADRVSALSAVSRQAYAMAKGSRHAVSRSASTESRGTATRTVRSGRPARPRR